jgi:HPt (histidine-containing phosphotransfer) domain-containing protein
MNNTMNRSAADDIASAGAVMDTDVFANFAAEVGHDGTRQIFNLFIHDTERRLQMMQMLSGDTDRTAIENEAHAMKGAAATFGFQQIGVLAGALENDAPEITHAGYRDYLTRLDSAFRAARRYYSANIALAA